MAWSSTVPAAYAAILGLFQAAVAAPAEVHDGPQVTASKALQVVIVGWNGQPGEDAAADATVTVEGLAGSPDREQYAIPCAVLVLDGGGDLAAARTAAYALLGQCGAAIAGNRTLGGVVLRAEVGTQSLRQDQSADGARVTVEFGIECDAYTTTS